MPGYDYANWTGVVAPAGTPKDIIARLNAELGKVINSADITETLTKKMGMVPETGTPEQLAAFMREMLQKNAKIIKSIGLKPQ